MPGLRFGVFEKSTGQSCSLQHVHYEVSVEDFFLRSLMTQEFENDRSAPAELIYRFAQNEKSTIYSIEVELYDPTTETRRILQAQVESKKRAQERYDDAIATGDRAMLAESDAKDPGSISLSLGNVGPHWQVVVRLSSVEEIPVENCEGNLNRVRMSVVIPSLNRSGQGLEGVGEENTSVGLSVSLSKGKGMKEEEEEDGEEEEEEGEEDHDTGQSEILSISSSYHSDDLFDSRIEDDRLSGFIRTKEGSLLSMNHDAVFVIEVAHTPLVSGLIEDSTAVVSVLPVFDSEKMPLCTEVILVVDCSGSMAGSRIEFAKDALLAFFERVYAVGSDRQVYFNIVRFGGTHESLYRNGSRELSQKTLREAYDYVNKKVKSDLGGTRMLPPLQEILTRDVVCEGFSRQVMFLTDGEDTQTEEVIRFVQCQCATTRIFSFGIGKGINPVLITRVAQVSNGRALFIEENSEIQEAVIEQIRYAMQPALTGVTVEFRDDTGSPVVAKNYLTAVPPCFNYQKYSLYFRLPSKATTARVSFAIGQQAQKECQVSLRSVSNHLNTLGSRRRVLELGDGKNVVRSEKETVEEEIRELGLSGHFITSQTSFIMVAENESEPLQEMQLEVVPAVVRKKPASSSVGSVGSRYYDYGGDDGDGYGAGAAYDDDDDVYYSSAPRGRAGCLANSNRVRILRRVAGESRDPVPMTVFLGEVREGDFVETVRGVGIQSTDPSRKELSLSFELCIGCCHHLSPMHCYFFETENGAYVGMTGIHLVQVQRGDPDSHSRFECMLAKDIEVDDRILVKEDGGTSIVSSRIIRITERSETVSMVYTMNGSMVVSGIVCSCFATQTRFKPFYIAKKVFYTLPKWMRIQYCSRLVDGIVHETFIREDQSKLHRVLVSTVMKIHDVFGGVKAKNIE